MERQRRILVVDDEPRVLKFVEIDLRSRGFDVITSTSGIKALELVRNKGPDILLLDILMPEIDGFEVLRQLRTFSDIPVIAFSAGNGIRTEALRQGASDFIKKPFNTDDIVDKINLLI
jgi:two-component system KDP operon response regulator KdpE